MGFEVMITGKSLAALFALEGLFAGVRPLVILEDVFVAESAVANGTGKDLVPGWVACVASVTAVTSAATAASASAAARLPAAAATAAVAHAATAVAHAAAARFGRFAAAAAVDRRR